MQLSVYVRHMILAWRIPYKRYQHQRLIHALRLALSVTFATVFTHYWSLSHSEWVAITVFVILGTMQYQGAITTKAWERLWGTLLGLMMGLALLWLNQHILHNNPLFFIAIAIISAICGWQSLGTHGYTAMLAGLTMCMLLGQIGNNWGYESAMRALNVIIGAAIALGASQLIPIKSTLMWRFTTADNLHACASQLAAISSHKAISATQLADLLSEQRAINARLVKARSMLGAMAQESKIPPEIMESMQQNQRTIVSSVNLLLNNMQKLPKPHLTAIEQQLLSQHFFQLQHDLRTTARLLKGQWRANPIHRHGNEVAIRALANKLPFEWQGFIWISLNIHAELFALLEHLQHTRHKWLMRSEQNHLETK